MSPPHWYSSPRGHGLFSEGAHLCLTEKFWREEESVAIVRHYIIEANNMEVQRHSATIQAYKGADYRQLLESCGFKDVTFYPGLTGDSEMADPNYCAITAHKRGSG